MKKIIILTFASTLLLQSCRDLVEGSAGNLKTEFRQKPDFNAIHIQGNIDVFLSQDTSFSVRVEAGENLMPYIETNVVNGEMIIYEAHINLVNTKPIRVYVNADSLNNIVVEGSGNFDGDNVLAQTLNILISGNGNANVETTAQVVNYNVKGSGDAYLIGNTNTLNALIQGSGNLNSRYLSTQDATVTISGSGNAVVTALNSIVANISGSGNIKYYGNPSSVSTSNTGSGTISGN